MANIYLAEIFYPGTWIDIKDRAVAFEIKCMLDKLVDIVAEASIALIMYVQATDSRPDKKSIWKRDDTLRAEIVEQLVTEASALYYKESDKYNLELDRIVIAKKAELGIIPESYLHKIPFMYAHSFMYAVDSFGKFLDTISNYDVAPKELSALSKEFDARLPSVRKIRNSALHMEDRMQRYVSYKDKKKGKKMNGAVFLGLSNLEGDDLCYTIDDLTYQRVAINVETLKVLVDIANRTLSAFPWHGPQSFEPR